MEDAVRIDDIESRTRKVEDAIIRFEYIADVILVQVDTRLCSLEKHNDEIQAVLYNTCEAKSTEIDDKVSKVAVSLRDTFEQYFRWSIAISATMCTLFIGYMAYDQGQKSKFTEDINARAVEAKENHTHIEMLHISYDRIESKLDRIVSNQAELLEESGSK